MQYFRGRSHVETNMAEQPPGQFLKSYPLYALRGIRVGLLAFAVTLVTMAVVKLARTGHADDGQDSSRAPGLLFVLMMMAVLTAGSAPFGEATGDHGGIFRFVTARMSRLLRPVVWPRRELRNG